MKYSKIYKVNLDYVDDFKMIKTKEYMKQLGICKEYINRMFNQQRNLKLTTAKSLISLVYNIPVRDSDQMRELLAKHFIEIK